MSKVEFMSETRLPVDLNASKYTTNNLQKYLIFLSSPRVNCAGPKGLRVESARAVTGRRCPHIGEGEDFLTRRLSFFYENGHNSGTKKLKNHPQRGK